MCSGLALNSSPYMFASLWLGHPFLSILQSQHPYSSQAEACPDSAYLGRAWAHSPGRTAWHCLLSGDSPWDGWRLPIWLVPVPSAELEGPARWLGGWVHTWMGDLAILC